METYAIHSDESLRDHLTRRGFIGTVGDGYDQMEALSKTGWKVIPCWGLRGWDLGSWPYVAVYRHKDDPTVFRVVTEGDVDTYTGFADEADRDAGISRCFVWWAKHNDEPWARDWDANDPPQCARGRYSNERFDAAEAAGMTSR